MLLPCGVHDGVYGLIRITTSVFFYCVVLVSVFLLLWCYQVLGIYFPLFWFCLFFFVFIVFVLWYFEVSLDSVVFGFAYFGFFGLLVLVRFVFLHICMVLRCC